MAASSTAPTGTRIKEISSMCDSKFIRKNITFQGEKRAQKNDENVDIKKLDILDTFQFGGFWKKSEEKIGLPFGWNIQAGDDGDDKQERECKKM